MTDILLAILGVVAIFVFSSISYKNHKKRKRLKQMIVDMTEKRYQDDLVLLETLIGKKIPEDRRKCLLTPKGHEIVTWLLDHTEKE